MPLGKYSGEICTDKMRKIYDKVTYIRLAMETFAFISTNVALGTYSGLRLGPD